MLQFMWFLVLLSNFLLLYANGPIVETTHGKVLGKQLKTLLNEKPYYGFMGIPYAAPPIKDLRFLPPQPIEPWTEVLPATTERPACIQYSMNIKKDKTMGQFGLEDCLYLDIFTPTFDNKLPVTIFLYNERFSYSYNKTKDYAPDFFIEEDIIIATISHRLNIFGFLSFEDNVLPGNSGLKDIVTGLEWIRNNIDRFGGDPNRITLMGSQGGAAAVDLLIHSKAKGLFNSAILQGGTSFNSLYLQENLRERAFKLAEYLERGSRSASLVLRDLNAIKSSDLFNHDLKSVHQDFNKEHQRGILPFGPIVEKDKQGLLTRYPEKAESIDIPLMIGFNSQEGMESALQYMLDPHFLRALNKDFVFTLPIRVNFKFKLDKTYDEAESQIKNFYFHKKISNQNVPEYVNYVGDLNSFPIDYATEFYSKISSKKVFYYYFDYESDFNENKNSILKLSKVKNIKYGAGGGDELCYLFKCPDLNNIYVERNKTLSEEIIMQRKMVRLWTNFIRYGNPTPDNDPLLDDITWPAYNASAKPFLHIGRKIKVRNEVNKKRFQFWKDFIQKWSEKAVDGIVQTRNTKDEL